ISGRVLHVRTKNDTILPIFGSMPRVRVTVRELEALSVIGSGDVKLRGARGSKLALTLRGSGGIDADGSVDRLEAESAGSGNLALFKLNAKHVDVTLRGSGNAAITATERLSARVHGSGDVRYQGGPREVERTIHGSGSIRAL